MKGSSFQIEPPKLQLKIGTSQELNRFANCVGISVFCRRVASKSRNRRIESLNVGSPQMGPAMVARGGNPEKPN